MPYGTHAAHTFPDLCFLAAPAFAQDASLISEGKRLPEINCTRCQIIEAACDLLVYVDEAQVEWIEGRTADKGYLPGTRMAAGVHSFYLRECYMANKLSTGKMVLDNVRIDLKKVKIPVYNLAAREDHIAPLASVFRVGRYMGGPTRLVVSGSGHIAGVVNPPDANKYQYWTNDSWAPTLEEWLKGAIEHPGSWWPDWAKWIGEKSGPKVPAPTPGSGKLKVIEDAPGYYVLVKAE